MNRFEKYELDRPDTPYIKPGVWWVECPKGNESQKFRVYSPVVQGVSMHYLVKEKRTVPCFKNTDLCPGGHTEKNRKWRCYVYAFSQKRHKNVFIQLTKDAWESWMCQVRPGQNLRGQSIIVHRTEKNNGRLWVEVEQWKSDDKMAMPADEDCKLSVFELWGFHPCDLTAGADLSSEDDTRKNGAIFH